MSIWPSILVSLATLPCGGETLDSSTFLARMDASVPGRGVTVELVADGGFVITGHATDRESGEDVLLLRTDAAGAPLWRRTFGGPGTDNGWAVRQTPDGGFVVVGYTDSFGAGGMDVLLLRVDGMGKESWRRTFGGEKDEYGWDVRPTADGGFILAAQTESTGVGEVDAWLVKVDAEGREQWSRAHGGEKVDRVFSVRQTSDGGYVTAGITYSFGAGDRDAYLLKTDAAGEREWHRTFGGPAYDVGHAVALTADGGYLVTGYGESFSPHGKRDVYLIKVDAEGEQQWLQIHGTSENERAMKGVQTADGGYVAVGFTQVGRFGRGVDWDAFLLKTDPEGNEEWTRSFGDHAHEDYGYTVVQTKDGGFVLVGHSIGRGDGESAVLLVRTDADGVVAE